MLLSTTNYMKQVLLTWIDDSCILFVFRYANACMHRHPSSWLLCHNFMTEHPVPALCTPLFLPHARAPSPSRWHHNFHKVRNRYNVKFFYRKPNQYQCVYFAISTIYNHAALFYNSKERASKWIWTHTHACMHAFIHLHALHTHVDMDVSSVELPLPLAHVVE